MSLSQKIKTIGITNLILILFVFSAQAQNDSIYTVVDKVPSYSKYRGNVQKALRNSLKYPVEDFVTKTEGSVIVSFIVTKNGELINAEVKNSLSETADAEALRVINSLKKWRPGEVNKQAVNTLISLPVHFKLSKDQLSVIEQLTPLYDHGKRPIFVVDKKKVTGLTNLEYHNVKSIRVIKGDKALKMYGTDAKDGVIVIETKRGTPRFYQMY